VKIALAQINPTVGDFAGNARLILDFTARAAAQQADLVIFPELSICGYPPADLLEKSAFLARAQQTLEEIAAATASGPAILCGTALAADSDAPAGKHARNVAALLSAGKIQFVQQKMLLPFYDVFDEQRYFEPAQHQTLTLLNGQPLAITICEDAWNDKCFWPRRLYPIDPVDELMRQWATLPDPIASTHPRIVLNISASPFWCGKRDLRRNMLAAIARRHHAFVVMVNQVGGNDSLVFDGSSIALSPTGDLIAQGGSFRQDLFLFDTDSFTAYSEDSSLLNFLRENGMSNQALTHNVKDPRLQEHLDESPEDAALVRDLESILEGARPLLGEQIYSAMTAETPLPVTQESRPACESDWDRDDIPAIWQALVLGTRDYVRKCGFSKALVALSGGIDSALVAAIAVQALGSENVLGIGMPSEFSSTGSIDDARALAENLGIRFELVAIHDVFTAYTRSLEPLFAGTPFGLAEENLQSRIRGALLMALSNKFGALVLTTGNKSEMSTGYCTLYGDMVGALAVIGDVFKTRVYALSHYANRDREIIPHNTIAKPPSAELRPGQRDTDSLPPYEILDPILEAYVERYQSAEQILAELTAGHQSELSHSTEARVPHSSAASSPMSGKAMQSGGEAPQTLDLALIRRVLSLVERSEYKRQQAAPILKVTRKSFGNGRRFPIAVKVEV
jgi:NAD+ synthase (glutamine-hydrolysing)